MILQRVKNLLWYPPSERKGRPLGSYSRTFPWKTLYYRVSVCSVPPLLLGVTGALIVRGPSGLAGFMLGFLIIYICFTLGVLTVLGATRLRVGIPQALVCAYVVKASLMGVVLLRPSPLTTYGFYTLTPNHKSTHFWFGEKRQEDFWPNLRRNGGVETGNSEPPGNWYLAGASPAPS